VCQAPQVGGVQLNSIACHVGTLSHAKGSLQRVLCIDFQEIKRIKIIGGVVLPVSAAHLASSSSNRSRTRCVPTRDCRACEPSSRWRYPRGARPPVKRPITRSDRASEWADMSLL
jgi:hypothetical protein